MTEITINELEQIVTDALERTAFVMVDVEDEDLSGMLSHHARVVYSGPENGQLLLSASGGFLAELASNLIGVEPDEVSPDLEGVDALAELANILGGSLVNRLGAESVPYTLGLPESLSAATGGGAGSLVCRLESEGEPLHVSWTRAA